MQAHQRIDAANGVERSVDRVLGCCVVGAVRGDDDKRAEQWLGPSNLASVAGRLAGLAAGGQQAEQQRQGGVE